ncbi:MAG: LacI family DNA-binding transcriptional regulator [Mesorhizobium sp.]|uniref:LacI family DNA-binding transcriptional regulator n=1 Tax=unclassified Mesorhizobium TaxID=325217 RepID=UPI000F759044|nr:MULTISPECIES: LacI family DNA-binding transcriptional regulator [unclassified Mesorhizobium]AZO74371.1 LacI family DNA-binding transcriptional regulator [Mesorhizobium sp. M1D.F.Ca.ET.043.01.1.1]RVD39355.1 LacI family DNA-binding transcriptional regulator [Mesorhizobium sp. M4A.F.Ca.ET.020.02.1.1]RWA96756.1 MAG: LacI family DNA-binding transcriptional regulator [Mesorhizobium sp.]RWC20624.1 MAG: LacI family DNA-binding transcriptional regulator [Mesorhizobium sp.]RWC94767.1 MAG: LacI family
MANLKQIAAELSLSVTTVSRALKDGPEVHPSTVARVKEVANRVGYVPDHHGRALKTGRTMTLTAVLPMETSDYLSDLAKLPLIEGMTLAARQTGYSLSIYSTTPDDDPVESMRRLLQARSADGLIITRMVSGDPRIKLLLDQGIPFVTFGRTDVDAAYPYVDIDNEQIAYDATRRLMGKGCRRIALQLLVAKDQASAARLKGYQRAMAEAGLPIDQSLIGHGTFTMESSAAWFDRLLASSDPPTGLACANELGLLGALHALGRRGLEPGRDVHIVTRDNTRLSRFLPANIGVHSVDMAAVGHKLIELLEDRIANPLGSVATVLFEGEFDPGEQVGPEEVGVSQILKK